MHLIYASQRYHELERHLEFWGYDVVREAGLSRWNDRIALAPLTGEVKIRGERSIGELRLSFSVTEIWVAGNVPGRHRTQGVSLDRYHYHGQAGPDQRIRWCLDEGRHKHASHVHRLEHLPGEEPDAHPPIIAEEALDAFEQHVFEMIQRGVFA